MKRILATTLLIITGFAFGLTLYFFYFTTFEKASLENIREKVVAQRDLGIKKAIAAGVYNCCIEPVCTMCYMEENAWNHQKAGRCDCAELIKEGQQPCPQCQKAFSQNQ